MSCLDNIPPIVQVNSGVGTIALAPNFDYDYDNCFILSGCPPSTTNFFYCDDIHFSRDFMMDAPHLAHVFIFSACRGGPRLPKRLVMLNMQSNYLLTTTKSKAYCGPVKSKTSTIMPSQLKYLNITQNDTFHLKMGHHITRLDARECAPLNRVKYSEGIISISRTRLPHLLPCKVRSSYSPYNWFGHYALTKSSVHLSLFHKGYALIVLGEPTRKVCPIYRYSRKLVDEVVEILVGTTI